jgi:hypothetical protein
VESGRAPHRPQTDPAPGLGTQREPSPGSGATALSVDVSVWLCRAQEWKDFMVAHAHGQYASLCSRVFLPSHRNRALGQTNRFSWFWIRLAGTRVVISWFPKGFICSFYHHIRPSCSPQNACGLSPMSRLPIGSSARADRAARRSSRALPLASSSS